MARGSRLTTGSLSERAVLGVQPARYESAAELVDSPLVPDVPQELPRTGAVALMTAVLEEAVRSCFSSGPQIRAEAEAWLMSGQQRSVFSFLTICESLGLDPMATRRAIRRLVGDSSRKRLTRRSRTNVRRTSPLSDTPRSKGSNSRR